MAAGDPGVTRRNLLGAAPAVLAMAGTPAMAAKPRALTGGGGFPANFLWGAATAGHQVEGNNVNSDIWLLENIKPTMFEERSGDCCDSYHRYEEDIALVKAMGLNTYRFSIEWSRIEPTEGDFSIAVLDHYRRMIAAVREAGIMPVVTFYHYSAPAWFSALGGWQGPRAASLFARYAGRAARHFGDLIGMVCTLNEPNIVSYFKYVIPPVALDMNAKMRAAAAKAIGAADFVSHMAPGDFDAMKAGFIASHLSGLEAVKSVRPDLPVGVALAVGDFQPVGENSMIDRIRREIVDDWLPSAAKGDFIGVQTYGRSLIDARGFADPPKGAELTQMGEQFYPWGLENAIRYVHRKSGARILVTENGIATEDDTRRVEYIRVAVDGVRRALADGVPVLGYIHWSLLDNYEWRFGYRPKFGLVAVDRATFRRTPKPSAAYLGSIARTNGI